MKQTVTSKYEPKSKNVTWIDMSTGNPVLKNFINGMWRPTSVGGGSDSGCDCGGFKYNELPEPVEFRDPTAEELNKYQGNYPSLYKVLDLKDGIIPDKIILSPDDTEYNIFNLCLCYIEDDEILVVYYAIIDGEVVALADTFGSDPNQIITIVISSDGSLMLVNKFNGSIG